MVALIEYEVEVILNRKGRTRSALSPSVVACKTVRRFRIPSASRAIEEKAPVRLVGGSKAWIYQYEVQVVVYSEQGSEAERWLVDRDPETKEGEYGTTNELSTQPTLLLPPESPLLDRSRRRMKDAIELLQLIILP